MRELSAGGRLEMLRHIAPRELDILVPDSGLDKDNGLALRREVRFHCEVPVIILAGLSSCETEGVVRL